MILIREKYLEVYDLKNARNIVIIVIVAALIVCSAVTSYNSIKTKQSNVSNSLKMLNVQIEHRSRLLENITDYLNSQSETENGIKTSIVDINEKMSSASTLAEKAEANKEASSVVNGIINYYNSNVESMNEEFSDKLVELRNIQVRISTAKNDYNNQIDRFNGETQSFPLNVVVKFVKTDDFEYFMTAEELQEHNKR